MGSLCPQTEAKHTYTQIDQTRKKRTKAKDGFVFCVGCSSLQPTRVSAKRNWKNQVQLKKKKSVFKITMELDEVISVGGRSRLQRRRLKGEWLTALLGGGGSGLLSTEEQP